MPRESNPSTAVAREATAAAQAGTPHIGYAAMLEGFPPGEAVELATLAEKHGFRGVMATDHFQPWTPQQGQASFVWNILSALGQTTTGDLGTGVMAPTLRMHPALTAQRLGRAGGGRFTGRAHPRG